MKLKRLSISIFSGFWRSRYRRSCRHRTSATAHPQNVDEVIRAMTLEEKVHMVIGCSMAMSDDFKFRGTAYCTYDIPSVWASSRLTWPTVRYRLAMAPQTRIRQPHLLRYRVSVQHHGSCHLRSRSSFPQVGQALGRGEVKGLRTGCIVGPGVN